MVRAGAFLLMGAGCALLAIVFALNSTPVAVSVVTFVAALGFFAAAQGPSANAGRANAGASAERRVGRILEKAAARQGAFRVVHGAELGGGGDADHVMFGPANVVIETKYGRGRVSVTRDGKVRAGQKTLPRDPIGQCERQRRKLEQLTRTPAVGIVCISEGTGEPARHGNVIVCGSGGLAKLLAKLDTGPPRGDSWRNVAPKS